MEKIKEYYRYSDSKYNFRYICEMNDNDSELSAEDIYFNLKLLLQTAHNYAKSAPTKEEQIIRESYSFSCIGDWIIKSQIIVHDFIKTLLIKKANAKVFAEHAYDEKISISEILPHYLGGHLFKYKNYSRTLYCNNFADAEDVLRKAIGKYNYFKYAPITKAIFEKHADQMIEGIFSRDCISVFGIILVESGANMKPEYFELICKFIKKKFPEAENYLIKYFISEHVN